MDPKQEALLDAQIVLYRRQARWETGKALAMILLAVAALSATTRLADLVFPPHPQVITVHLDAPLTVGRPAP